MAKDHYIPASLIGRFSDDESPGPLREKKVLTLRRNGHRAEARAESIGYSNNLYNVDESMFPTHGTHAVDKMWSTYESDLPRVLDRMVEGKLTAKEWINTLVPFVAASCARDRGYKHRVTSRLAPDPVGEPQEMDPGLTSLIFSETNIALNRVLEMERFAARAIASQWIVYQMDDDVVLPDVGYGFNLVNQDPDIIALMLPIGKRHILTLTPSPEHQILTSNGDIWSPCISYAQSPDAAATVNLELAKTAQDFLVATSSVVRDAEPASLGTFDWAQIDRILNLWPYNVDTRELMGLYPVVRALVNGEIKSVEGIRLDRYHNLTKVEPKGTLASAPPEMRADRLLTVDDGRVFLTVHLPDC